MLPNSSSASPDIGKPNVKAMPSATNPLGANAMINLAKIASSQNAPQHAPTVNTNIRPKQLLPNIQPAQQLRPLQGSTTISLPAGVNLPAGTVLMQNDKGQLIIVSRPMTPQTVPYRPSIAPVPVPNTKLNQVRMGNVVSQTSLPLSSSTTASIKQEQKPLAVISDDVKKCKHFLETLLRLSSQQPHHTYTKVKNLMQGLLTGTIPAEDFTEELQKELKSQKQPGLAPFLKKSLPELRAVVRSKQLSITGLGDEWLVKLAEAEKKSKPKIVKTVAQSIPQLVPEANTAVKPAIASTNLPLIPATVIPQATATASKSNCNVSNIKPVIIPQQISQTVLEKPHATVIPADNNKLTDSPALHKRVNALLRGRGISSVSLDVFGLLADSCKERLKDVLVKTIVASEHRIEVYRMNNQYTQSTDTRSQVKFLEGLDKLEKKRKDDLEREKLLRAAKSRTKTEDPEQAILKQKAKEMQQAEMEEARQRDANLTALAAIGRKRKQPTDSPLSASSSLSSLSGAASTANPNQVNISMRPRLKKLNLRDMQYVAEKDKQLSKSLILFKSHVR